MLIFLLCLILAAYSAQSKFTGAIYYPAYIAGADKEELLRSEKPISIAECASVAYQDGRTLFELSAKKTRDGLLYRCRVPETAQFPLKIKQTAGWVFGKCQSDDEGCRGKKTFMIEHNTMPRKMMKAAGWRPNNAATPALCEESVQKFNWATSEFDGSAAAARAFAWHHDRNLDPQCDAVRWWSQDDKPTESAYVGVLGLNGFDQADVNCSSTKHFYPKFTAACAEFQYSRPRRIASWSLTLESIKEEHSQTTTKRKKTLTTSENKNLRQVWPEVSVTHA